MSVRLEPWTEDDLPLVQALLGDPVMMEHLEFEFPKGVFGPSNDWYYDLSARSRGE